MDRHHRVAVATLIFCAVFLPLSTPRFATPVFAQANGPGSGFVDPEGIPLRPTPTDIEPVYRDRVVDTLATVRQRGKILVGVGLSVPMVMQDRDGNLKGFSIDVARELADDLGVEVEFVQSSWSHIVPDLLERHFDIIVAGLWMTPTRALVINYTQPTATEGIHLIASRQRAGEMKRLEDFNRPGVTIAAYADTVQERLARRRFSQAKLLLVEGDELEIAPVLDGRADAVLVPTFAPNLVVSAAADKLFLPLEDPISSTLAAMGVRKGDVDFLNFLNTWIAVHRAEGWFDERARHWADQMAFTAGP